jgi:hypothetical protein
MQGEGSLTGRHLLCTVELAFFWRRKMSDSSLTGRAWRRFARQFQLMLHELFVLQSKLTTIHDLFDLSKYMELRRETIFGDESYLVRMKLKLEKACYAQSLIVYHHDVIMDELLMQGTFFSEGNLTGDADEEAKISELIRQDLNHLLKLRKRLLCFVQFLNMITEWFDEDEEKIMTTIFEATIGVMWEKARSSQKVA